MAKTKQDHNQEAVYALAANDQKVGKPFLEIPQTK
jgi:hypothetical protein